MVYTHILKFLVPCLFHCFSHYNMSSSPLIYLLPPVMQISFAQRCFDLIEDYAPGFNSSIIGYDMLTPPDLEREIGLTGKLFLISGLKTRSVHTKTLMWSL